jgi:hypothetical protein
VSFFLAWVRCRARQGCATPTCVAPSMTSRARQASRAISERKASEGRLQHAITVQREKVEFQRLSTLLEGLPAGHPARSSWLEVDDFRTSSRRPGADADHVVAVGD